MRERAAAHARVVAAEGAIAPTNSQAPVPHGKAALEKGCIPTEGENRGVPR